MVSGTYDPRSAVRALLDTAQRNAPRIVSSNVPGLGEQSAPSFAPELPPVEGLCLLIDAIDKGTVTLPPDFDGVKMSGAGLKAHVRPDGGICHGFFGSSPEDAVVVYGDPLMPREQVQRVVLAFWQQIRVGPFKPTIELVRD